jgi:hypothetical protein
LQKDVVNPEFNAITVVDGEEIKPDEVGRKYKIVTREYLAQGNDGSNALAGNNYLIDEETGQIMSSTMRKYLLSVCDCDSCACDIFVLTGDVRFMIYQRVSLSMRFHRAVAQ